MSKIYEVSKKSGRLIVERENNVIILTSIRNNGMVEVVVLNDKDILEIAKKIKGE